MGLFGSSEPAAAWTVDVITLEYLVSGSVGADAQKWGWCYFQPTGTVPATPLTVDVTAARATGRQTLPALAGTRAAFAFNTGLVAVVPRDPGAQAVWEQWNTLEAVPVGLLIGPYSLSGEILSPDGTAGTPIQARAFGMRNATLQRVDGDGDGAAVELPCATVTSAFVHTAVSTLPQ